MSIRGATESDVQRWLCSLGKMEARVLITSPSLMKTQPREAAYRREAVASCFQSGQAMAAQSEVRLDTRGRVHSEQGGSPHGQREGCRVLGQDALLSKKACYEET